MAACQLAKRNIFQQFFNNFTGVLFSSGYSARCSFCFCSALWTVTWSLAIQKTASLPQNLPEQLRSAEEFTLTIPYLLKPESPEIANRIMGTYVDILDWAGLCHLFGFFIFLSSRFFFLFVDLQKYSEVLYSDLNIDRSASCYMSGPGREFDQPLPPHHAGVQPIHQKLVLLTNHNRKVNRIIVTMLYNKVFFLKCLSAGCQFIGLYKGGYFWTKPHIHIVALRIRLQPAQ